MEIAHSRTVDEVLDYFQVSPTEGLSNDKIDKAREEFGLNGIVKHFTLNALTLYSAT